MNVAPYAARPAEVPSQLVSFQQARRSFVLHNANPKPVSPMFIGNILTVPPVHEVGPNPGFDSDGDPIPGTRLVEDLYHYDAELQDEVCILDAMRCVIHVLGLTPGPDGKAASAASQYALGGLSLLPANSPKPMWKKVAAEGEKRAFAASVERAKATIRQVEEANAKRKAANVEPLAGDYDYERALFLVNQANALVKAEVASHMAPHQIDAMDDELEMDIAVKAIALELATKAAEGKTLDRLALAQELLNDPAVRVKLQKQYQIRKRGNMPVPVDALKAAAVEGQTVEEAELEP